LQIKSRQATAVTFRDIWRNISELFVVLSLDLPWNLPEEIAQFFD